MRLQRKQLINFTEDQLLFDEEETRAILTFFFPHERTTIAVIDLTFGLRSLAQGLLVEAVDASFAMGWLQQTIRWFSSPGITVRQALRKLLMRGLRYWFSHPGEQALMEAQIYECIRVTLQSNFHQAFVMAQTAKAPEQVGLAFAALIEYPAKPHYA